MTDADIETAISVGELVPITLAERRICQLFAGPVQWLVIQIQAGCQQIWIL